MPLRKERAPAKRIAKELCVACMATQKSEIADEKYAQYILATLYYKFITDTDKESREKKESG